MRTKNQNKSKKQKGGRKGTQALARPMLGIDQKAFQLNDIFGLVIRNPVNSTTYKCTINCDVNGYTWQITDPSGAANNTGSAPYGATAGQFGVQALMYSQYYTKSVTADLTLSQGGAVYSMSPIVTFSNPNGDIAFGASGQDLAQLVSSPLNTQICQPYSRHEKHISYEKWLMAMTNRAWRKSIGVGSNEREFYPTDQTPGNEGFVLPSMTTIFEVTIPENTFAQGASRYVVGLVKTAAHYEFSQRRTDIASLVQSERAQMRADVVKSLNDITIQ